MIYMGARYYEPSVGRFISEDPARDGYNWYVYGGNDPCLNIDYTGKAVIAGVLAWWGVVASAFLGALGGVLAGFEYAVAEMQKYDPSFNPSQQTALTMAFAGGGAATLFAILARCGPVWGSGIGLAKLAPRLGIVASISFLFGLQLGIIVVCLIEIEMVGS